MRDSTRPPADWTTLLTDAVTKPGVISEAYRRFWRYSTGNQILALWQCALRGIGPGPLNTFLGWKDLSRHVKKGEKALTLCMPVTVKDRERKDTADGVETAAEGRLPPTRTVFVYRPHWFVLSQTDGQAYTPPELPDWSEERALTTLEVSRVAFTHLDGNAQGFARDRSVAVSPIAFSPHRTLFHELAHVLLGHTEEKIVTPGRARLDEVEAECVALICGECLGLDLAEFSRGYIQHWLEENTIPERSVQRIFKAADAILKAGRPEETGHREPDVQPATHGHHDQHP